MKNKYTNQRYILRSNEVKNMEEVIQVEGEFTNKELADSLNLVRQFYDVTRKSEKIKCFTNIFYHRDANGYEYILIEYRRKGLQYRKATYCFEYNKKQDAHSELKDRVFDLAYNWYLKPIRSTSEEKLYKWG